MKFFSLKIAFLTSLAVLSACGGGNSGTTVTSNETPLVGYFIDSPVAGLTYSSGTYSGTTNSDGSFNYAVGSRTTFSIGNVTIGSVDSIPSDGKLTVYDAVGVSRADTQNAKAAAVAQFLQTVATSSGGTLSIPVSVHIALASVTPVSLVSGGVPISQSDLGNLVSTATSGAKTLVTAAEATTAMGTYLQSVGIDTSKGLVVADTSSNSSTGSTGSNSGGGSSTAPVQFGTIQGVVATGIAVAKIRVNITDLNGITASATTDSKGTYSLKNPGFTSPIIVTTDTLSGGEYTKLVSGSATLKSSLDPVTDTINVTPATTMLMAAIVEKSVDSISAADATKITSSKLSTKQSSLNNLLKDVKSILNVGETDFISDSFTANQQGVDKIFDTFKFGSDTTKISITSREGYKPKLDTGSSNSYAVTPFDWLALKGETINKIAISNYHACALLQSTQVYCWGKNGNGSLGNGTFTDSLYVPVRAGTLTDVTDIVTEDSGWTCALTKNGSVYCWGTNGSQGQLGVAPSNSGPGRVSNINTPTLMTFLSSVTGISLTGSGASCALISDGTLTCWGDNGSPFDVSVDDLGAKAIKFSAGGTTSCVLLETGVVKCFGWGNSNGELGNATTSTLPNTSGRKIATVLLKSSVDVSDLAAGLYYACALFKDGTVQCWGKNTFGQLGNKNYTSVSTPTDVSFSKAVISVKASATHTCAIILGGDVQCWGRNDYGQLGVAAATFADDNGTPMAVSNEPVTNTCSDGVVTSLSLAYYTSCGLTSQGHYQCWGSPANDRATSQNASASSCQGKSGLNLSPF